MNWRKHRTCSRDKKRELWRVHAGSLDQAGEPMGYLITETDGWRSGSPIAYVRGVNPTALHRAKQILGDVGGALKREGVVRISYREFQPELFERLIYPANASGRAVRRHDTYRAMMYVRKPGTERQVAGIHILVSDVAGSPVKQKRGTPAVPFSSAPPSNEGREARTLTAA